MIPTTEPAPLAPTKPASPGSTWERLQAELTDIRQSYEVRCGTVPIRRPITPERAS